LSRFFFAALSHYCLGLLFFRCSCPLLLGSLLPPFSSPLLLELVLSLLLIAIAA
jgi:hypothetical protein